MADDVTLRDVVRQDFVGVTGSDTVANTLSLLAEERTECAVVLHGGSAIGIVEPSDLYATIDSGAPDGTPITEVMRDPPPSLAPDARLEEAATLLFETDVSRILVTDDDDVLGVVDARDILAMKLSGPLTSPSPTDSASTDSERDRFASQSICEACGSLSRALTEFNGQLLCPDCRSI